MTAESLDDLVARLQLIDVGLTKHRAVTFKVTSDAQSIFTESANAIVALRADAERYRWVRVNEHMDVASTWLLPHGMESPAQTPEQLDAAIDAARLAEKDKGG